MPAKRSLLLLFALLVSACAHAQPVQKSLQPLMAPQIVQAAPSIPLAATSQALLDTPVLSAPTVRKQPTSIPTATAAPEHTATPVPPTSVPHIVQRVVIGDIVLDRQTLPVGLDDQAMPIVPDHDIGWYIHSGGPGQGENIVLWGHALRFLSAPDIPAPFGRLKELAIGAQIVLYDETGAAHTYAVTQQVWATPDQVDYILPTGSERLTLVSCIGDRVETARGVDMSHRLITIAEPVIQP